MSKVEKYSTAVKQVKSIVSDESDLIANLANICAILRDTFNFFWVGFYLLKNDELVLGPFQGPLACTRIALGKGVCGTSAQTKKTIIVPDVHKFEGHIACNPNSLSEIVVPLLIENTVFGVLDIDSDKLDQFDDIDRQYLEDISTILVTNHFVAV